MAQRFKNITRRFFIIANILFALLLGLSALIPYADPQKWWWLNFIGLAFPYLFFITVFFFLFWIVIKPGYSFISILIILICWRQVITTFRLNMDDFNYTQKENTTLRVLSWNVKVFEGLQKGQDSIARAGILTTIKSADADIVCLQEFSQYDSNGVKKNHLQLMEQAGFPYAWFSADYEKASVDYRSGVAIFSKTPLLNARKVPFTSTRESIISADVVHGTDTIRIFTTHLQSFRFSKTDYRSIEWIKKRGDITNPANLNLVAKMKTAIRLRSLQARQIRPLLDSCPYPEIVCGDFNDVPNSYTYWHIRGNRKDAFIEKGNGSGRTFISLAPMLRIDYLLYDERLVANQFVTAQDRYSDHLPVIADFELKK